MSEPFSLLDDAQLEYFGQSVILDTPAGYRHLAGVFDDADDIAQVKMGGYVKVSQPQLEIRDVDAVSIERNAQFIIDGQRYCVVAPPKSKNGWTTFILVETNEQQNELPDIRY